MRLMIAAAFASIALAQSELPYHVVPDWAKLPAGWNFGECSGVAVDHNDNVWIFNRGPHTLVEFDRNGNFLKALNEIPVKSSHGIRVGPDGNLWIIDVAGHKMLKLSPERRVLTVIGGVGDAPADNDSPDGFNRPTNIAFAPDRSFFISDRYVNSAS